MSATINALFGTYSEGKQQNITGNTNQIVAQQSVDDVQKTSIISSETQASALSHSKLNIDGLLAELSTTHAQIDQYSRTQTVEITEEVQNSVIVVLENTRHRQEELIADANHRHLVTDYEYKIQLQKTIEVLDAVKAKRLADLEDDLQEKQQLIMNEAKKQIDILINQANTAIIETQEQPKQNIENLTNQVETTDQQETENLLQSTISNL